MATQETFKIKAGKNPNYTIIRTEPILPNMAKNAEKYGKEPIIYYMQGWTRTGRKSKETLMCFRYTSGKFIKV